MHPLTEQILCHRFCAFFLCRSPEQAGGTIKNEEQLVLLGHMLYFTVIHEDSVAEILRPHARES